MTNTTPIVFESLDFIEIDVTVGKRNYKLREASGDAATRYRNAQIACTKLKDGQVSELKGLGDLEPMLVSLCLFDDEDKNVQAKLIRSWPARIQKQLFNKAKEISDLNEEEETVASLEERIKELKAKEEKEGNSSESTEIGSS